MARFRWLVLAGVACVSFPGAGVFAQGNEANGGSTLVLPSPVTQRDAVTNALGDSAADLAYTPVTPCRLLDTRKVGGMIAGGTQRDFSVTAADLSGQGGSATGCGVPVGATAIMVNLAAVTPQGPGNLRAWAVANPQPAAPGATVLNYFAVAGVVALANGIAVPICDPTTTSCMAGDLRLQADVSATHVVADVVGYFRNVVRPTVITLSDSAGSTASTTDVTIASMFTDLKGKGYTKARLVARYNNDQESPACSGSLTIDFVDANRSQTLASLTETCGVRAWYDESAAFDIQPAFFASGTSYDLRARAASGTGVWRWVGLEVW